MAAGRGPEPRYKLALANVSGRGLRLAVTREDSGEQRGRALDVWTKGSEKDAEIDHKSHAAAHGDGEGIGVAVVGSASLPL